MGTLDVRDISVTNKERFNGGKMYILILVNI